MLRQAIASIFLAFICMLPWSPSRVAAKQIVGSVAPTTPMGHYLSLEMTIDDAVTRFELTGPDYSFFAFGFDTTTMMGYSLIVEGLDANRTVVEQNLAGIGDPGSPQAMQNINVVAMMHDAPNDLTTVVIERPNDTVDPLDPDFATSLSSLNVIWAYYPFATPEFPQPDLTYHSGSGRGFATIAFTPEPTTSVLVATAAAALVRVARESSAKRSHRKRRAPLPAGR
jgi:hypothetical protein